MAGVNDMRHCYGGLELDMARWEGFEPPTAWFVARNSIQLSYQRRGRIIFMGHLCVNFSSRLLRLHGV
jgi:hypothetical protein